MRGCFLLFVVSFDLAVFVLKINDDSDLHVLYETHQYVPLVFQQ